MSGFYYFVIGIGYDALALEGRGVGEGVWI
jgi:hypothetical protein